MPLSMVDASMVFGFQARGSKLFAASGTFNPADFNLKIGDTIMYWVVGGGMGGGSYSASVRGKGANSTFNGLTALGGGQTGAMGAVGGVYLGKGDGGGAGGGGGGFIPGLAIWGGNGVAGMSLVNPTGTPYTPLAGLGGGSGYGASTVLQILNTQYGGHGGRDAGGGICFGGGGGNSGNACSGGGGAGFGAGGGGASVNSTSDYPGYGGNAGEIKCDTARLTSMSPMTVTVGGGGGGAASNNSGTNNMNDGKDGTTTGGGAGGSGAGNGGYNFVAGRNGNSSSTGGGGAGGCVWILW